MLYLIHPQTTIFTFLIIKATVAPFKNHNLVLIVIFVLIKTLHNERHGILSGNAVLSFTLKLVL